MKLILKNGKFYINMNNFKEAILIEDGIIKQIGSNKEVLNNDADNIIDLEGKTVLPGFNDSHMHLLGVGQFMNSCNLTSATSINEIIKLGKRFIKDNKDLSILEGRGWNQDYFTSGEKRLLNRFDLDKISTDIPIIFTRVCGHLAVANTKALEILNMDKNISIDGGTIGLDDAGNLNGIFTENAINLIYSIIPEKNHNDIKKDFLKAANYILSLGITSVQSCDINNENYKDIFNIIHSIYENNEVKLRYNPQFNFQDIEYFKEYLESEFRNKEYNNKFLSKGILKLFKDGSLGARTALMLKDYKDAPGIKGVEALSDKQLQDLCDLAIENKITVITHAIGDAAIESVINIYEKTMNGSKNPLRHGIVHCQITSMSQLERIAKLNIPVMYQPIFLDYDIQIIEDRVGKDLAKTSYAFDTLNKLGAPISFGTDAPVEDCNPFPNIYCAVTRQRLNGEPKNGFNPQEKMTIEDVIDAYTIGSAFNEFKENYKGRLIPGYLADLIVLDRDIFSIDINNIKDIKVEKTMVDGEFVFER